MKRIHKVMFFYPGSLFPETEAQRVRSRDPKKTIVPKTAFGFQFFDVIERKATREDGQELTDREVVDKSGMYYPGGEAFTAAQVKRLAGNNRILLSNMSANGWKKVVQTRCGNFQPLNTDDVILK